MGKYEIKWRKLVTETLPFVLRNALVELIVVLLKPAREIHFRLLSLIDDSNRKLSYNSQYPNLQRLLNDLYDNAQRRIVVADEYYIEPLLIFPEIERRPVVIGQKVIYPSSRYGYQGFTVLLPNDATITSQIKKIESTLNQYKFSGVKHKIIING